MKIRCKLQGLILGLGLVLVLALLPASIPLAYPAGVSARIASPGTDGGTAVTGLPFTPDWTAEANLASAYFGQSVASAGDVNGDGYDDVIVGASGANRAYVYHGSASGLSATPDWTVYSAGKLGVSVASAGDVNGDNYDDVIVGAPDYTNDQTGEGRVYVYHGSASGLSTTPDWQAESDQAEWPYFGQSVASAGDVNGDTFDDIIVGAYAYDNGQGNEGAVFVWYGSNSGLGPNGNPANADWMAEGDQDWAAFGVAVGTAGDVNGDNCDDVIVGAYWYDHGQSNEGAAFAWYGSSGGLGLNGTPANADWTAEGNQDNAWFGSAVATAGDVNGDTFDDVVVGAVQYSHGQSAEGQVFVYHGSGAGLSPTPNWTAESNQADARLGADVGTAGDVNNDGYDDLAVGAAQYDQGQQDEGRLYVYHGSAAGLGLGPDWTAEGDQEGVDFGLSAGTAGDVNDDGYGDLIVGAMYYSNGQVNEGRAFAYYGGPPPAPRTLILVNRQRMESSYGDASALMAKLYELAAHPGVVGIVAKVEDEPAVAAAYTAWAASPDDAHANSVALAIRDQVIAPTLAMSPTVEYLVLVGRDWIIPFYRAPDNTPAPYNDPSTHTDNFYADRLPTSWAGHDLYIPDLAIGRLVEAPVQIVAQIDAFLADDAVTLTSGAVVAYDFLKDSAQMQCAALAGDGLTVDCSLIGESWTRNDFITDVLNARHDLVSLNQHANYNVLGTPLGNVNAADFSASPDLHARAIFWSPGCHSGQNVSGALDLPEALAQKRATYIASTGFGWGCQHGSCLAETLMENLAQELVTGTLTTAGEALVQAKQRYFAASSSPTVYDEKVAFESTLYGLPMYQVSSPGVLAAGRPAAWSASRSSSGVQPDRGAALLAPQEVTHTLAFTYTAVETGEGSYYVLDGWVSDEAGAPVQPRLAYEVSSAAGPAHGVLFAGGAYTTAVSFAPAVQQVLTMTAGMAPAAPAFEATDWYPTLFHGFNRLDTEQGVWETLVATLGQYRAARAEERLLLDADFVSLHSATNDWQPPAFSQARAWLQSGVVHVQAQASDGSGVYAVLAVYNLGDGLWRSLRLVPGQGDTWEGSFPAGLDTELFFEAADNAGNVALRDDDGAYFRPEQSFTYNYLPLVLRNYGP
jgi:hypothetical protein